MLTSSRHALRTRYAPVTHNLPTFQVTTIFSTPTGELKMQNSIVAEDSLESLVCIQARPIDGNRAPHIEGNRSQYAVPYMVTTDRTSVVTLCWIQVPRIYFVNKRAGTEEESKEGVTDATTASADARIASKVMREFVGMEEVDEPTQHALVDFSCVRPRPSSVSDGPPCPRDLLIV